MDEVRSAKGTTTEEGRRGVPEQERLESWKAIAEYLARDERTVRRWETSEGLPVHRHYHHRRATVYAYRHELDAWRVERGSNGARASAASSAARRWRPSNPLAAVATIAAAALVALGIQLGQMAPTSELPRMLSFVTFEMSASKTRTAVPAKKLAPSHWLS